MTSDFMLAAKNFGIKVYYCNNTLCVVEKCDIGREIADIEAGKVHRVKQERLDDRAWDWVPVIKEKHLLTFADGSKEYVKSAKITKAGCDQAEVNLSAEPKRKSRNAFVSFLVRDGEQASSGTNEGD